MRGLTLTLTLTLKLTLTLTLTPIPTPTLIRTRTRTLTLTRAFSGLLALAVFEYQCRILSVDYLALGLESGLGLG